MKKILAMFFLVVATGVSGEPKLQRQFDSVGPVMKTLESASTGRSIFYLDEGTAGFVQGGLAGDLCLAGLM